MTKMDSFPLKSPVVRARLRYAGTHKVDHIIFVETEEKVIEINMMHFHGEERETGFVSIYYKDKLVYDIRLCWYEFDHEKSVVNVHYEVRNGNLENYDEIKLWLPELPNGYLVEDVDDEDISSEAAKNIAKFAVSRHADKLFQSLQFIIFHSVSKAAQRD